MSQLVHEWVCEWVLYFNRETKLVRQVVMGSDVILTTLTSSSNEGPLKHLPPEHLDLVVIDECSQAGDSQVFS